MSFGRESSRTVSVWPGWTLRQVLHHSCSAPVWVGIIAAWQSAQSSAGIPWIPRRIGRICFTIDGASTVDGETNLTLLNMGETIRMQIWEFNSLILFNLVQPFRMVAFLMVLASKIVIPSGVPYCSWSGPFVSWRLLGSEESQTV